VPVGSCPSEAERLLDELLPELLELLSLFEVLDLR
jgi:hypothetical protein